MAPLALRLDVKDRTRECLDKFLTKFCDAWIVAFETTDDGNDHVHAILHSSQDIKKVRNGLIYYCKCSGNGSYSLKHCTDDPSDYIRYICKGPSVNEKPLIWTYQGLDYSQAVIDEAHAKYWVTNAALKENGEKRRRLNTATTVEALEKLCKEKGYKGFDRVSVAKEYISMYVAARKPINVFAARAVVNTVCCVLDLGDQARDLLASVVAQL